jgi:cytochrome c553
MNERIESTYPMIIKAVLTAVVLAGVLGASCAVENREHNGIVIADSDSYEASMFRQNCAVCHGKEAYGKMVNGKLVPSLRSGDAAKRTRQEIYNQIANGKLPMPAFKGQLTESEINRMVRFVMEDLQGRKDEKAMKAER